jgi:hypothetical protein
MSYQVFQTARFGRQYKKLHNNVACDVDSTIIEVANNPLLGEQKKGDLANLYVYKYLRASLKIAPISPNL